MFNIWIKKNSMKLSSVLIVSGEEVHLIISFIIKLKEICYGVWVAGPVEHPRFSKIYSR